MISHPDSVQRLGSSVHQADLELTAPSRFAMVDITEAVDRIVEEARVLQGMVWVFCRHTTCGVMINELEDGLTEDFAAHAATLVQEGYFAHDDLSRRTQNLQGPHEPANGPAHVRQMLFGATSQAIPIADGQPALGAWQRVLFVELDEPKARSLLVTVLGVS